MLKVNVTNVLNKEVVLQKRVNCNLPVVFYQTLNNKEFDPICSYADTRTNKYTGYTLSEYRNESIIDTINWRNDMR